MIHPPDGAGFTRRTFLKTTSGSAAAAAAAASLGSNAHAANLSTSEQFLLDRITFGRSPDMVAEIQARGYTGFLNWQLQLAGEDLIDDSGLFLSPNGAAYLENPSAVRSWTMTPYDIVFDPEYRVTGGRIISDAPQLVVRGGWFSEHQLRWVMTEFFQNVHNTYLLQPQQQFFWVAFLRDAIYEHALGNYGDMLKASGQGGSMLLYLGQPDSNATNPNENYGRELLELHSQGVKPYSIAGLNFPSFAEADIAEVAKILTGWDMVGWNIATGGEPFTPELGDFRYTDSLHTPGNKVVSNTGPNGVPKNYPSDPANPNTVGLGEGEELMTDLVAHPLTALHMSRRLVQWFLGDDYENQFRQVWIRTAVAFNTTGGDIKATIAEMFDENHIDQLCPAGVTHSKVRFPVKKVVGFQRALEVTIEDEATNPNFNLWYLQMFAMGQVPGAWPAPNGYQPQNEKWIGSLQPMVQFYYDSLFGGTSIPNPPDNGFRVADTTLDTIFGSAPLGDFAMIANDYLFGGCMPAAEEAAVQTILLNANASMDLPGAGDLGLMRRWALFFVLASPSYQYLC